MYLKGKTAIQLYNPWNSNTPSKWCTLNGFYFWIIDFNCVFISTCTAQHICPLTSISLLLFLRRTALSYYYSKLSWLWVKGGDRLILGWDSFVKQKRGRILAPSRSLIHHQNRKLFPELHYRKLTGNISRHTGGDTNIFWGINWLFLWVFFHCCVLVVCNRFSRYKGCSQFPSKDSS